MVSDAYSSEYMIKTEFPAQGAHGKVVVTSSITVAGRTVNPLVRAGRTSAFFTKGNKANILLSFLLTATALVLGSGTQQRETSGHVQNTLRGTSPSIMKVRSHKKPQGLSEDFMDQPVKCVHCVKRIRAD